MLLFNYSCSHFSPITALSKELTLNQRTGVQVGDSIDKGQLKGGLDTQNGLNKVEVNSGQVVVTLERSKQRPKKAESCHGGKFGFHYKCNKKTFKQWETVRYF